MAKFLDTSEFDGPAQFDSKLFVNSSLWDNLGSSGSSGQVLSKDSGGQVVWATPSGGGTIDGSGAANKLAIWSDADTLTSDTNLHWDTTNDRLGIGTTSPNTTLHIADPSSSSTTFRISAQSSDENYAYIRHTDNTFNTSRLDIGSTYGYGTEVTAMSIFNGNVGIGTTSPTQLLHVEGGFLHVTGGTSNAKNIRLYVNDSWGYLTTSAAKFYLNQELRVDTGLIGSYNEDLQLRTSGNTRITVNNSSGNVGIGTASPSTKLEISGTTQLLTLRTTYASDASQRGAILWKDATNITGAIDTRYNGTTVDMHFGSLYNSGYNTTSLMVIKGNGSLQLNNYGSGTFTGTATQRLGVDSSGNVIEIPIGSGAVDGSGTANYVTKWTDADTIGNSIMYDNGTNVGIGTTSPAARLDIFGIGNAIQVRRANGYASIKASSDNGGNLILDSYSTGAVYINNYVNRPVYIATGGGNVGIGTTAPNKKLSVNSENSESIISILRGGTNLSPSTPIGALEFYADYAGSPTQYAEINAYSNNISGVRSSLDFAVKSTSGAIQTGMTVYGTNSGVNVGIGTTSPTQKLHVNGSLRVTDAFYDSGNQAGTSGQILSSTGTKTDWVDANAIAFRDTKTFFDSWKVGSTGTVFFDTDGGGSLASIGYQSAIVIPYNGNLRSLIVMTNGTQTGFTFSLVNQSGSALWTSSSTTLTANTATTFTPNATITKSTDKTIHLKMTRATSSSGNYSISITAVFEWDL